MARMLADGGPTPVSRRSSSRRTVGPKAKPSGHSNSLVAQIAAQKARSAAKIPRGTQPIPSPTQLYQAAAAKKVATTPTTSRPAARSAPVAKAPVKAVAKAIPAPVKSVAKAAPKPTTVQGSGTAAKTANLSGSGAYGRFDRQRKNRGPRGSLSITPEMLQAIARQRIVNYR